MLLSMFSGEPPDKFNPWHVKHYHERGATAGELQGEMSRPVVDVTALLEKQASGEHPTD